MHILLPSDVFPPRCGGAGWSAHALALGLLGRGHRVTALVPKRDMRGLQSMDVLGVPTWVRGYSAPGVPFVQNYFRHERLWPTIAADLEALGKEAGSASKIVIHAQHVQVTPAAVLAGQRLRVPVVVTIRDHWPWDYFATGMGLLPLHATRQTWASLAGDLLKRLGLVRGMAAFPAIPYMQGHMLRRQAFLRRADAVVAVSEYMAERLRQIVDPVRVHVIPNMVDLASIRAILTQPMQTLGLASRFLLYVGKLEQNKGVHLLPELIAGLQRAGAPPLPLVVAGDGALRQQLEAEVRALGVQVQFLEWVDHDEVLRLMAHCELLLYPSAWGEPLSRVLLEACACGTPIAAMPTGGTADIVIDGRNGVLAATAAELGKRAAGVLTDSTRRKQLVQGAVHMAENRFAATYVVTQFEQLYEHVSQPV